MRYSTQNLQEDRKFAGKFWHTACILTRSMADNILVMPGPAKLDLTSMHNVADEFGWKIKVAEALGEVAAVTPRKIAAVFFHRDAFGTGYSWRDAIRFLKVMLPGVPLVVMRGFSEVVDWTQLSDEGAFHSLWLPLKESEVRQSLGFLSNAERRPAHFPARSGAFTHAETSFELAGVGV